MLQFVALSPLVLVPTTCGKPSLDGRQEESSLVFSLDGTAAFLAVPERVHHCQPILHRDQDL